MSAHSPARHDLHPQKSLGQNFLVDPRTVQRILSACELKEDDVVLEIGPGLGALTRELAERVRQVYAIETDARLYEELCPQFADSNVTLIKGDVLRYNFAPLPLGMKVIGNLPYNISTPIIEKILNNRKHFQKIFFTVQLEFGQRLAAQPNSKDYGSLSCFLQYHADVKVLFKIRNSCFRPIPKVTSCLMRIDLREPLQKADDEDLLFTLIRQAFSQRRKIILNTLAPMVGKEDLAEILKALKISGDLRAENLALTDYIRMANAYVAEKNERKKIKDSSR